MRLLPQQRDMDADLPRELVLLGGGEELLGVVALLLWRELPPRPLPPRAPDGFTRRLLLVAPPPQLGHSDADRVRVLHFVGRGLEPRHEFRAVLGAELAVPPPASPACPQLVRRGF